MHEAGIERKWQVAHLSFATRVMSLIALLVIAIAAMLLVPPMPQSPAYHLFRDVRTCLGVPNGYNVLSNAPFSVIGALGLVWLARNGRKRLAPALLPGYAIAFTGIFLTGFGSAWYHLAPDNATLFWDRLPMAFAFMGLYAAVIGERVSLPAAAVLALPLALIGAASVAYWRQTDDLRFYALVQFFPVATIPLLLWLFPALYTRGRDFLAAIGFYIAAMVLEKLDAQIYDTGRLISGHTLKHLLAAAGAYTVYRMLTLRTLAAEAR